LLETILKIAGTVLVVGAVGVAVYTVFDALFGSLILLGHKKNIIV